MTETEQRKRAQLERIDSEMEQRKRTRLERAAEVESDTASLPSKDTSSLPEDRDVPKGFICPLTMEVMFDPVLDPEGNTYERRAIIEWLRHKRNSPVSRQPLNDKMLIPNNALRETIHELMGTDWSDRQVREHPPVGLPLRGLSFRAKIDCYLQSTSQEISGVSLCLNEHGHCIFQYENIVIVLYVPESVGVFCFYTRQLVPIVTDSMKDLILELNFLQGETRGGCLSTTRNLAGRPEVLFSYSDRIPEVTADDFRTTLFNFVETAASLRRKLLMIAHADKLMVPQPINGVSTTQEICRNISSQAQGPPKA